MEDVRELLRELQEMSPSEQEQHLHRRINDLRDQAQAEVLADSMRGGGPPRRQITPEDIRSRFGYHKATEKTGPKHQSVRSMFISLGDLLADILPDGRAKAVCFTELESASMWANKAIAEQAPVVQE